MSQTRCAGGIRVPFYSYNASTNQYYAEICNSADTDNPQVIVSSTDTYPLNQWHFVEMKYKFNGVKQKVDADGKMTNRCAHICYLEIAGRPAIAPAHVEDALRLVRQMESKRVKQGRLSATTGAHFFFSNAF